MLVFTLQSWSVSHLYGTISSSLFVILTCPYFLKKQTIYTQINAGIATKWSCDCGWLPAQCEKLQNDAKHLGLEINHLEDLLVSKLHLEKRINEKGICCTVLALDSGHSIQSKFWTMERERRRHWFYSPVVCRNWRGQNNEIRIACRRPCWMDEWLTRHYTINQTLKIIALVIGWLRMWSSTAECYLMFYNSNTNQINHE